MNHSPAFRIIILLSLLSAFSTQASVDFSGTWKGPCTRGDLSREMTFEISQSSENGEETLSLWGKTFRLGKTTEFTQVGEYQGQAYRETTVYDFAWNDERNAIVMETRWLGRYLDQSGTWVGHGRGGLSFEGKTLLLTRNVSGTFTNFNEVCRLEAH